MDFEIMGIDPGLTGAIAVISSCDGVWLEPMPRNENGVDVPELVRLLSDFRSVRKCYIESIYAVPKSGAHSMMVFGKSYGIVIGVLTALGIPFEEIKPKLWMKEIHAQNSVKEGTKDRSRRAFREQFPDVNAKRTARCHGPDIGLIEATLIAEYGRRQQIFKEENL